MNDFTKLPDGSAFGVFSISISRRKNLWKKMKMLDWWLRRPRYNCPMCGKGLYTYWDGNDVTGHGTDYCNACAAELESRKMTKPKELTGTELIERVAKIQGIKPYYVGGDGMAFNGQPVPRTPVYYIEYMPFDPLTNDEQFNAIIMQPDVFPHVCAILRVRFEGVDRDDNWITFSSDPEFLSDIKFWLLRAYVEWKEER